MWYFCTYCTCVYVNTDIRHSFIWVFCFIFFPEEIIKKPRHWENSTLTVSVWWLWKYTMFRNWFFKRKKIEEGKHDTCLTMDDFVTCLDLVCRCRYENHYQLLRMMQFLRFFSIQPIHKTVLIRGCAEVYVHSMYPSCLEIYHSLSHFPFSIKVKYRTHSFDRLW